MNPQATTYFRSISIFSFILFVVAAWFSVGYHHPDEYFQILEFCNYKLGNISAEELPWEFKEQIRPSLQIFITYGIIKFFGFFSLTDPFIITFVLRLVVGIGAWYVTRKLAFALFGHFKTDAGKQIFFALLFFTWFVPYVSVRFSSENTATIIFLFAVLLFLRKPETSRKILQLLLIGLLFGLSFYFRFQMLFAIFGFGLWIVIIHRIKLWELLLLLAGSILAVLFCIGIDYWFYGNWVLTPVNYFTLNIVKDIASGFGVSPWWEYIYLYVVKVSPLISIPLLLFFFYGARKNLRDPFLWCIIPFLIVHFLIGHKELRFLFPMIFPFIYLAASGIDHFISTGALPKLRRPVLMFFILITIPFLCYRSFSPANEASNYFRFLYHYTKERQMELVCFGHDVYQDAGLPISFYRSPNIKRIVMPDRDAFIHYLETEKPERVYVYEIEPVQGTSYKGYVSKTLYAIYPDWIVTCNINNWTSRAHEFKVKELVRI